MDTPEEGLQALGQFVLVGKHIGVIVGRPGDDDVPEEHYAVWYGEKGTHPQVPRCRTVPMEYCKPIQITEYYH
jgi:hypothetical protein